MKKERKMVEGNKAVIAFFGKMNLPLKGMIAYSPNFKKVKNIQCIQGICFLFTFFCILSHLPIETDHWQVKHLQNKSSDFPSVWSHKHLALVFEARETLDQKSLVTRTKIANIFK